MRTTGRLIHQHPLRDDSGGRMKAWPGGEMTFPNGVTISTFRTARPGEIPTAIVKKHADRWVYCKYCYKNTLPLILRETLGSLTFEMTICAGCCYGLTPSEEVTTQ